jgi:hypothetical protein
MRNTRKTLNLQHGRKPLTGTDFDFARKEGDLLRAKLELVNPRQPV